MSEESLVRINALDAQAAKAEFLRCCGSSSWAVGMTAMRPFERFEQIEIASESLWPTLTVGDWLEAFTHHPKIGDIDSLRTKFASTSHWAGSEQAGASAASEEVLNALAQGNAAYEQRFGYIFIVCATGKSAAEMLDILRSRLPNDPEEELKVAAEEQKKITRLRLRKLH